MDQVKFFNEDLKDLFNNQPFEVAKNLEGDVFREYENRVTKRFEFHQRTYFIKNHGPVGWREIVKNLLQIKTPVIGARREYEAIQHLSRNAVQCPKIKGIAFRGLNPAKSSSFLITEELDNTISLEDFFLKRLHEELSFRDKKN